MKHAQEPVFVFRLNGQIHVFRQGVTAQSAIGSYGVRISLQHVLVVLQRLSSVFVRRLQTGHSIPVSTAIRLLHVSVIHHT